LRPGAWVGVTGAVRRPIDPENDTAAD